MPHSDWALNMNLNEGNMCESNLLESFFSPEIPKSLHVKHNEMALSKLISVQELWQSCSLPFRIYLDFWPEQNNIKD